MHSKPSIADMYLFFIIHWHVGQLACRAFANRAKSGINKKFAFSVSLVTCICHRICHLGPHKTCQRVCTRLHVFRQNHVVGANIRRPRDFLSVAGFCIGFYIAAAALVRMLRLTPSPSSLLTPFAVSCLSSDSD